VKRPGHEADHSPPSSAEIMEIYLRSPNTPSWYGVQLKKRRKKVFRIRALFSTYVSNRVGCHIVYGVKGEGKVVPVPFLSQSTTP
jgi:hypothetical protein